MLKKVRITSREFNYQATLITPIRPYFPKVFYNLFIALNTDPTLSRINPAFVLYPFLCFFFAIIILTILDTVFCKFCLALNCILIIFLNDQSKFLFANAVRYEKFSNYRNILRFKIFIFKLRLFKWGSQLSSLI